MGLPAGRSGRYGGRSGEGLGEFEKTSPSFGGVWDCGGRKSGRFDWNGGRPPGLLERKVGRPPGRFDRTGGRSPGPLRKGGPPKGRSSLPGRCEGLPESKWRGLDSWEPAPLEESDLGRKGRGGLPEEERPEGGRPELPDGRGGLTEEGRRGPERRGGFEPEGGRPEGVSMWLTFLLVRFICHCEEAALSHVEEPIQSKQKN